MHEHKNCKHKLEYCPVCDVAYCAKCERQWYAQKTWYYYYSNPGYVGNTAKIADYKDNITTSNTELHNHEA